MKDIKLTVALALLLVLAIVAGKALMENRDGGQGAESALTQPAAIVGLHEEYSDLPEANAFTRESGDAIATRLESGTGIVFLGFKECPWCQKLAPVIDEVARAEGVKVHYLDIKNERANNSQVYLRLASILSPYLAKDDNGQPRITVPDVSFVRNGEIIGRFELESVAEAEQTPDAYWTEERKKRAAARFQELITKMQQEETNERL